MRGTQNCASLSKKLYKRTQRKAKLPFICAKTLTALLSRVCALSDPRRRRKAERGLSITPFWRNSISSTICSDLCRDPEPRPSTSVCSCGVLNKPGSKTILRSITKGKNNSKRGIDLIKNGKTIMDAQVIFPCVVYSSRIIKTRVIKDNRKQRGSHDEELKSNSDGTIKANLGSSCHDPLLNFWWYMFKSGTHNSEVWSCLLLINYSLLVAHPITLFQSKQNAWLAFVHQLSKLLHSFVKSQPDRFESKLQMQIEGAHHKWDEAVGVM